ncbi:inosine-uridine preferring nucleoside hydrolase-like precursor [Nasonia vitripennis]|uniref:Inosine/uridine-preferring nucleoside hydrolase domain-containing protein n=1 Tax=Nasonia vitripennis TaxID=7425 RepID=A0A7M6W5P1_NASVI|nr:inosine-uridine preferring nucleoside hydrolase-like precursor [Nasonia vitripennis]
MIGTVCRYFSVLLVIYCLIWESISGEKIIIDTDAGGDDAVAILMMLRSEAFKSNVSKLNEIIGITCTYGNTKLENVEINVLKILTIAGRDDIPVYSGAHSGIIEKFSSDNVYGKDGFGDAEFNHEIIGTIDRSKHAAVAIVDIVKANSGNVSIIALGPLTNLAIAMTLEKNLSNHVNRFYIMGGSVAGIGNIRPNVEFNFAADPVSNFVVFNATRENQIMLLPWETAIDTDLTKEWRQEVFAKYDSPYVEFLNKVENVSLTNTRRSQWVIADAMTAACFIEPNLVITHVVKNVDPVTFGEAKGSVLVDYAERTSKVRNTKLIQKINKTLFKEILIRYLTCGELPCEM